MKYMKGIRAHPLFKTWYNMMRRCYNPKDKAYRYYGARGIVVCERWHDPLMFFADMHPKPSRTRETTYSLDRINNNGNYEPSNCRWATSTIQARNRRKAVQCEPIQSQLEKQGITKNYTPQDAMIDEWQKTLLY